MTKTALVGALIDLNSNLEDQNEDLENIFRTNCEQVSNLYKNIPDDELTDCISLPEIQNKISTYESRFIALNFYLLKLLNNELSKSDLQVLSVRETKELKIALKKLTLHGILKNLQPSLPHFQQLGSYEADIFYSYSLLKSATVGFYNSLHFLSIRTLILPHFLQSLLVATFQISCSPLKKPNANNSASIMTEELYKKFLSEQKIFGKLLENMRQTIHPAIFVKETMVLFQASAPLWFKKSISNMLTTIIRSEKGVQVIASTLLDGVEDDTAKTWKILEVLTKLILSCRHSSDFKQNICQQVITLAQTNRELLIFERLMASCTKCLYWEDEELCRTVFLAKIVAPLLHFSNKEHKFRDNDDVTAEIEQTVRLLHLCFVDKSANSTCLPISLLENVIGVIFYFYHLTVKSQLHSTSEELKAIFRKYMQSRKTDEMRNLLDNFLFGLTIANVGQFRDDVVIEVDQKIVVKNGVHSIIYATADVIDTFYNLLKNDERVMLFQYLLQCLTNKEKYFLKPHNSKELLDNDDHVTSTVFQRLIKIHERLSQLCEDQEVQRSLKERPDDIIQYINTFLTSHPSDPQLLFTVIMILDNLIGDSRASSVSKYKILTKPLSELNVEGMGSEFKEMRQRIIKILEKEGFEKSSTKSSFKEATEFEKALEDVCDPLLPTRGHGLMVLAKLVEKKDKQAIDRKQYLLNLFQLHLKDEDSFIYLSAIQGLGALADLFPDTVLEVLCEEYSDFSKTGEGAPETRMKLGEVLLRAVKLLGEMAPKYKSLLLNTFLSVTKDEDHLIRASSLSNLGEVCRILNYKLGTIVSEVLACVHAIIATDKAAEARRAAVTVIRQLFVGLQSEMIAFLKEDILPVYRTLKNIYCNDKDDVMRLQAQLALEELNENMKNFVFPSPQLYMENKIFTLE